jgi:hypothetical protein
MVPVLNLVNNGYFWRVEEKMQAGRFPEDAHFGRNNFFS